MLMLFSRLPRPPSESNFSCYLINGSFMKFLFSFLRPRLAVLGGEKHFRGKRNNAEGIKTFIKHHKQKQGKNRNEEVLQRAFRSFTLPPCSYCCRTNERRLFCSLRSPLETRVICSHLFIDRRMWWTVATTFTIVI